MLKVIGAGFPRTGTTSTKAALERLGFGPCHHMFEVMTHAEQVDRLLPVASGERLDWDHVLEGYNSTQDWPSSYFWREQAEAYPEAKVLLTVRDPHAWYVSMTRLMEMGPRQLAEGPEGMPEEVPEFIGNMIRLRPVLEHISTGAFGPEYPFFQGLPPEDVAVEAFLRHTETVRAALPAERLLVFDVREGWEPLCRFLEVPVPDEPFPHLNDADTMQSLIGQVAAGGPMPNPFEQR